MTFKIEAPKSKQILFDGKIQNPIPFLETKAFERARRSHRGMSGKGWMRWDG